MAFTIKHKRNNITNSKPDVQSLEYGELAIRYSKGDECIFIKNDNDEIIEFNDSNYFRNLLDERDIVIAKSLNDLNSQIGEVETAIDEKVQKLISNQTLKFYCVEPVSVTINDEVTTYNANTFVFVELNDTDALSIETTSDSSILSLNAWPGALDTFYPWLEGVQVFDGIVFDMNSEDMYVKWNQGHQGEYHVQMAQYNNCVFWSDNPYISDVSLRTNYTLYNSAHLPLCYSTIPENTYKAFYSAYGVKFDPNWSNLAYLESFAAATWATQTFSYYGAQTVGIFNMDSPLFNIVLPKDCRGLMFYSPTIENAGVFDAVNVTNFGAKSGSWRDAFGYCYNLKELYIKNLKVNLNVSWSPISQDALNFILSNAANTSTITISLSPITYYTLTVDNINLATEKNITLELISTNVIEDERLSAIATNGDGNSFLSNDGTYKEIATPNVLKEKIVFTGDNITMLPNIYYRQSTSTSSLSIYLMQSENETFMNEFLLEFDTATNGTTISLPSNIKWANGEVPVFENGATYQISIVNNLGVCIKFN